MFCVSIAPSAETTPEEMVVASLAPIDPPSSSSILNSVPTLRSNGGALAVLDDGSSVTIKHSRFWDNLAENGGAASVSFEAALLMFSTIFISNQAESGGAIHSSLGYISGEAMSMSGNIAFGRGGAMYGEEATMAVSWSSIQDNDAEFGGGVAITRSSFHSGSSILASNAAHTSGGALFVEEGSRAELSNCSLLQNRAMNGGAVYVEQSTSVSSNSDFSLNHATRGGVVFVHLASSTMQCDDCQLGMNTASAGGFLYHTDTYSSSLTNSVCDRNIVIATYGDCFATDAKSLAVTHFPDQKVQPGKTFQLSFRLLDYYNQTVSNADSGTVQLYEGGDLNVDQSFSLRGVTLLNLQGGEAAFESLSILPKYSAIQTQLWETNFEGGSATKFVMAVASYDGKLLRSGPVRVLLAEHNESCASGSILQLNPAMEGECEACSAGTYSVSPLATACTDCPAGGKCLGMDFFDSRIAGAQWQSEYNAASRTMVQRIVSCLPGYILVRGEDHRNDDCVACPNGTYSLVPSLKGSPLQSFETVNATKLCASCPYGARCDGRSHVEARRNFWLVLPDTERRAETPNDVAVVYRCPKSSCLENNECVKSKEGKLCFQCSEGWAMSGSDCLRCSDPSTSQLLGVGVGTPLLLLLWYFSVWRPLVHIEVSLFSICENRLASFSSPFLETLKGALVRILSSSITDYWKIAISFWQVISTFESTYVIEWPPELISLWELGVALRLDVFNFYGLHCVSGSIDFVTRLKLVVVAPLIIIFMLAIPTLWLVVQSKTSSPKFKVVYGAFWYYLLAFLYLVYPFLSTMTVTAFNCRKIGDKWWLVADMSRECIHLQSGHSGDLVWAIVGILLYPLGVPLFLYAALRGFAVDVMAKNKYDSALLNEMILKVKKTISHSLIHKIARFLGGGSGSQEIIGNRARAMFEATAYNEKISSESLISYLSRLGIHGNHEEDLEALVLSFDADRTGQLAFSSFQNVIQAIMLREETFSTHHETVDSLTDSQLEFLCRFRWFEVCDDDPHETSDDLLKRAMVKQLRSTSAATSSASPPSQRPGEGLATVQDKDSEDNNWTVCHLPSEAPRDAKLEWVLQTGKNMKLRGLIAVPPLKWSEESETERDVLDKLGFILKTYKVENWAFELVEMLRKCFMTSVVVILWPGSIEQLVTAFIITSLSIVLYSRVRPFTSLFIDNLQGVSLAAQAVTLFYGILLEIGAVRATQELTPPFEKENRAMRIILFLLNILIFLFPVVALFYSKFVTGEWSSPWKTFSEVGSKKGSERSGTQESMPRLDLTKRNLMSELKANENGARLQVQESTTFESPEEFMEQDDRFRKAPAEVPLNEESLDDAHRSVAPQARPLDPSLDQTPGSGRPGSSFFHVFSC